MVQTKDIETDHLGNSLVRLCEIVRTSGSCGFNLTKSKWDPYPWISNVEDGSPAESAGVQAGDCLLEVNGEDVLGLRVAEVANKVKAREEKVTVMLWTSGVDPKCSRETLCCGPMPTNLQRLSTCMSNIVAALECPICLDTIPPPAHQCANGHLICLKCRVKTDKCPVCRLKLFRGRSLLADQVYNSLIDAFDLRGQEESQRRKVLKQRLFGPKNISKTSNKPDLKISLFSTPTNKFLTRLMRSGKCSSAENLTTNATEKNSKLPNTLDEFHSGLKAKSLSSNEIFSFEGQNFVRTPSVLSGRTGSGLLEVQPVTYSKRPASYHGSVEELHKRLITDFGSDDTILQNSKICNCPCDPSCQKPVTSISVLKHIQENHEGPILHFFKPKIELQLPLLYEESTILMITVHNTAFIIKILDYSCKNENNHLWVWSLNSKQDFTAIVTIQGNGLKITSECPVISLESIGWKQILDENLGVLLNLTEGSVKLILEIESNTYE